MTINFFNIIEFAIPTQDKNIFYLLVALCFIFAIYLLNSKSVNKKIVTSYNISVVKKETKERKVWKVVKRKVVKRKKKKK